MEQDEDSYPNFSNAFPSSTTSSDSAAVAASWNPALRQNAELPADSDDDFFERYPDATPKKPPPAPISGFGEEENSEFDASIRRQSISVQYDVDVTHDNASAEDLRRVPSNHVEVEGPGFRGWNEEEDEEEAILEPGDSAVEQEVALEERMPDVPYELQSTQDSEAEMDDSEGSTPRGEERMMSPSEHYEHQGEITEMEEAQEPSETIPLMDDEEPLPTPGDVSRQPSISLPSRNSTLGFDGTPAPRNPQPKADAAMPQLDRSFTTNFSESPVDAGPRQHRPQQSISQGWPSIGDDKTFGELLDKQPPASQTALPDAPDAPDVSNQIPSASITERAAFERVAAQESQQITSPDDDLLPEDEGHVKEEDLAAAWGAALDDDDLLEETPTNFDPSNAFGGDDDGFLADESPVPVQTQQSQQQQRNAPATQQYRSQMVQQQQQQQQYGSNQQSFSQSHGRSAGTPSTGLYDVYNNPQSQHRQQPQPSQRPGVQQAQSFVDKDKGGYQSPYDLPMEVVKPRRRPQQFQQQTSTSQPTPPPRSSSMTSNTAPTPNLTGMPPSGPPPAVRPMTRGSAGSMSPPQSSHSGGSNAAAAPALGSVKSTPKTESGFFEELPATMKPRARPNYAPTAISNWHADSTNKWSTVAAARLLSCYAKSATGWYAAPAATSSRCTCIRSASACGSDGQWW